MDIDGGYGEATEEAVRSFQLHTFGEDIVVASIIPGVVDLKTWAALFPEEARLTKTQIRRKN
jgi:peptidoglycan hydrolase-like protein with peptidoglycan-binding domain